MDKIKKLILPSSNYKSRISLNDSPYYFTALHDEKTFTFFIQHMRFRNFSFLSSRSKGYRRYDFTFQIFKLSILFSNSERTFELRPSVPR